jgi:hypothetical protein
MPNEHGQIRLSLAKYHFSGAAPEAVSYSPRDGEKDTGILQSQRQAGIAREDDHNAPRTDNAATEIHFDI